MQKAKIGFKKLCNIGYFTLFKVIEAVAVAVVLHLFLEVNNENSKLNPKLNMAFEKNHK
jgi:hypothetical protein